MTLSSIELMNEGMQCLIEEMGVVKAEEFISLILRERFDYTQWQRAFFDKMAPGEFGKEAAAYARNHPYTGDAERL